MYSLQSGKHRGALALWDPDSGNWSVNWTPSTSATPHTPCQWGTRGDVPVGAIGSAFFQTSGTNYSSFTVFRSADVSVDGKPWLYSKQANGSNCGGATIGRDLSVSGASFSRSRTQVFTLLGLLPNQPPPPPNGIADLVQVQGDTGQIFSIRYDCWPYAPSYGCGQSHSLGDQFAVFL